MPFETPNLMRKRVAVIGGGISGMGATHHLAKDYHVTLIEAEPRLGGHARTVMAGKNGDQPVDTGFIVFNHVNYPNLVELFEELSVPIVKSNMSFGASFGGGKLEYALESFDTIFAQRSNALNPRFLRMIYDITKFNKRAPDLADGSDLTIGELLAELGTGDWFRDHYLMPFTGAIWSTPRSKMMDFPAHALLRFMKNHGLLGYYDQHQWYTVEGGSIQYVSRLTQALQAQGVDIRIGSPVKSVRRTALGVEVSLIGGQPETFDEVVFATHSDQALALLADASPEEQSNLSAVRYQPNEAALHCDASLMPKRRKTWSSWVYCEAEHKESDQVDLSYWMNSLQPIPHDDPHFVTLNSTRAIREECIYDTATFHHPLFDNAAIAAQGRVAATNGTNRTWFCGAWMKNGFHEDGLSSGIDVARALRSADLAQVAA